MALRIRPCELRKSAPGTVEHKLDIDFARGSVGGVHQPVECWHSKVQLEALKRTKDFQEKSLHDTIAILQSDKAVLAEKKGQLEKSLVRICLQVRGLSQAHIHPVVESNSSNAPAQALPLTQDLIDDASTFRAHANPTQEQVLMASMVELASYTKASIEQYMLLCCTLKDHKPDMLRRLEMCELETCTLLQDSDHADARKMWTTIIDVSQLSLLQKQSLLELRQVLSPRQCALWIVLAWPRMYDAMALLAVAAEDLEIASCFNTSMIPDMPSMGDCVMGSFKGVHRPCSSQTNQAIELQHPTSPPGSLQPSCHGIRLHKQHMGPFSRQASIEPIVNDPFGLLQGMPPTECTPQSLPPKAAFPSKATFPSRTILPSCRRVAMSPVPDCLTPPPHALNSLLRDVANWS
ncbi:hypothetical protein WJX74_001963 [Apatococcus lobatus]|uniref:Uncharacterized protein n=1 Tax=Apatococcus lobatus TaxID=904363 RepID=A0AAW1SAX9_9CHLO